jgi:5,10-methylenetetrahydromethanopterin reductase
VPGALAAIGGMKEAWAAAGRPARELYATAWVCGCVLAPGEAADSPRAVAQAGPRAATLLHRAADLEQQGWRNTMPVGWQGIETEISGYTEMARGFTPADARYLENHRGHFVYVKPEERRFISAELIRRTTFTATEQELVQRIEALRSAGWNQIVIPVVPGEERALDDWARVKAAFA